jgi:hypothetical protein
MSELQELKKEAGDLGLTFHKTIGATALQEKIDTFYTSQETSGPVLQAAVEEKEKEVKVNPALDAKTTKRIAREKAARLRKVVTIIDNDQRVNNQTTTCTVNCSNEFFDLGTVILPLNEKIEVCMGHIITLEEVKIPLHMRDQKTGLTNVRLRPRYTISYENM